MGQCHTLKSLTLSFSQSLLVRKNTIEDEALNPLTFPDCLLFQQPLSTSIYTLSPLQYFQMKCNPFRSETMPNASMILSLFFRNSTNIRWACWRSTIEPLVSGSPRNKFKDFNRLLSSVSAENVWYTESISKVCPTNIWTIQQKIRRIIIFSYLVLRIESFFYPFTLLPSICFMSLHIDFNNLFWNG